MRQTFVIKIQSISDIITNSSSEVFVINTSSNQIDSIVKDILNTGKINFENDHDFCSGMGGELGVYTWENGFRKFKHNHVKYRHDDTFTPEKWAEEIGRPLEELKKIILVDIDWSREETIQHIKLFYGAIVDDDYWVKYDFIDDYTDYDDNASFDQDYEDCEEWERDYIESLRTSGIPEKTIQEVLDDLNIQKK
jgi:hypothetical protein